MDDRPLPPPKPVPPLAKESPLNYSGDVRGDAQMDRALDEELGAPRCPNCHRVMSNREHEEQGCCNDCYDGTIPWHT